MLSKLRPGTIDKLSPPRRFAYTCLRLLASLEVSKSYTHSLGLEHKVVVSGWPGTSSTLLADGMQYYEAFYSQDSKLGIGKLKMC